MALNPVLLFLGLILCDHLILTQRLKVLKASGNPCGFAALRETSFPLVTVSAMASQPLPRHPPIQQRLPKRFSAHRRLGGPFPTIFPVTAVLAASSQAFPRSSPKWQGLSKRFPTHRPNGRGFRSIFHGYDLNRQKNGGKEWIGSDSPAPILLPSKAVFDPLAAVEAVFRPCSAPQAYGNQISGTRQNSRCFPWSFLTKPHSLPKMGMDANALFR
jgi:hypothetical protein